MLPSPGFFKRTHTPEEDEKQIDERCAQHELLQGLSVFSATIMTKQLFCEFGQPLLCSTFPSTFESSG